MTTTGLANDLYAIIGSEPMVMYDHEGNITYEPEMSTNFFLKTESIMIELDGEEKVLMVSLSDGVDAKEFEDRYGIRLRKIAINNTFKYTLRTYGKKLTPKDFSNTPVLEGLYGSTKSSYQNIGGAKVIIRHSTAVNEDKRGSRTKNIKHIFVETSDGERFKIPHENLHGARAIAYHLNNRGTYGDTVTNKIIEMIELMEELKTQHAAETDYDKKYWIRAHYLALREELKKNYSSNKRYSSFVKRNTPAPLKESVDYAHWAESVVPSDRLDEEYDENIVSKYLRKTNLATKDSLPQIVSEMIELGIINEVAKHLYWPIKPLVLEYIEDTDRMNIQKEWKAKVIEIKRHKISVSDAIANVCEKFGSSSNAGEIEEMLTLMAEEDDLIPKNPNDVTIDRILSRNKQLYDNLEAIKAEEFYGQPKFVGEHSDESLGDDLYSIWIESMRTIGQGLGYKAATDEAINKISAKYKISYDEAATELEQALDAYSSNEH